MLFEYTFCCKPTVRDSLDVQYESILCFYVVIFRGESVINYKTGLSKRKAHAVKYIAKKYTYIIYCNTLKPILKIVNVPVFLHQHKF